MARLRFSLLLSSRPVSGKGYTALLQDDRAFSGLPENGRAPGAKGKGPAAGLVIMGGYARQIIV